MKKLIWKELMEQRFIPLAYAVLAGLMLFMWYVLADPHSRPTVDSAAWIALYGIVFAGLLPGCSSVSSETKKGTLQFLTMLPAGRKTIWLGKVISGLSITGVSILAVFGALSAMSLALFGLKAYTDMLHRSITGDHVWGMALAFLTMTLIVYFISALVSTLITSAIPAFIVSIGASLSWFVASALLLSPAMNNARLPWVAPVFVLAATLVVCVCASYLTFCKGENLRTRKRFMISSSVLIIGLVFESGTGALYAHLQAPPDYRNAPFQTYNLGSIRMNEKRHVSVKLDPRFYPDRFTHADGFSRDITNIKIVPYWVNGHAYNQLDFDFQNDNPLGGRLDNYIGLSNDDIMQQYPSRKVAIVFQAVDARKPIVQGAAKP